MRFKLKPLKELSKMGVVFRLLEYSNSVILTTKKGSMKSFPLSSFNKTFIVDDTIEVLSNIEMNEYKDFLEEMKEEQWKQKV